VSEKQIPDDELLAIGYRLAKRHGGQHGDRDDAAQDFCLGALKRRVQGGAKTNPRGLEYAAGHRHQRKREKGRWAERRRTAQLNGHDQAVAGNAETLAEEAERAAQIDRILAVLRLKERAVVVLRFGLYGGSPRTQAEVAALAHRSRERIRQIERRAIFRLRKAAGVHICTPFDFSPPQNDF